MCDQTPVEYKDGDVVWVKLGPCWWPGEVYDLNKLPEEVIESFRKLPIAAVKFFDEDKFEYVKTIDKIYSYNCTKKNDFIKKGLSLFRSKKQPVMQKFPEDIQTAERKTNGDPEIINSSIFSPEVRPDYTAIFGSAKSKKSKKSVGSNKSLSQSFGSPSSSSSTPGKATTVPRMINRVDHDVRILVQTPIKLDIEIEQDKVTSYDCSLCGFKTSRINIIIMHNKSHIPGMYDIPKSPSKRNKKSSPKKRKVIKMTKSTTASLLEDLELIEKGSFKATESSDEEAPTAKKAKSESHKSRKRVKTPKKVKDEKSKSDRKDIRRDLLAEWDDDSNDIDLSSTIDSTTEASVVSADESVSKPKESKPKSDLKLVKLDLKLPEKMKSCFDFDEEDEEQEIISTSVGRKIPRVIPHTEWQKLLDSDHSDDDTGSLLQSTKQNKAAEDKDDPDLEAFKHILDTTTVPSLPEIPQLPGFEQNFPSSPPLKFSKFQDPSSDKDLIMEDGTNQISDSKVAKDRSDRISLDKLDKFSEENYDKISKAFQAEYKTSDDESDESDKIYGSQHELINTPKDDGKSISEVEMADKVSQEAAKIFGDLDRISEEDEIFVGPDKTPDDILENQLYKTLQREYERSEEPDTISQALDKMFEEHQIAAHYPTSKSEPFLQSEFKSVGEETNSNVEPLNSASNVEVKDQIDSSNSGSNVEVKDQIDSVDIVKSSCEQLQKVYDEVVMSIDNSTNARIEDQVLPSIIMDETVALINDSSATIVDQVSSKVRIDEGVGAQIENHDVVVSPDESKDSKSDDHDVSSANLKESKTDDQVFPHEVRDEVVPVHDSNEPKIDKHLPPNEVTAEYAMPVDDSNVTKMDDQVLTNEFVGESNDTKMLLDDVAKKVVVSLDNSSDAKIDDQILMHELDDPNKMLDDVMQVEHSNDKIKDKMLTNDLVDEVVVPVGEPSDKIEVQVLTNETIDEVVVAPVDFNDKIEDQVSTNEAMHEVAVPVDVSSDKIEEQVFTHEAMDEGIVAVEDSNDKIRDQVLTNEVEVPVDDANDKIGDQGLSNDEFEFPIDDANYKIGDTNEKIGDQALTNDTMDEVVVPVHDSGDKIEDQGLIKEVLMEVVALVEDSTNKIEDQPLTKKVLDEVVVPVDDFNVKIEDEVVNNERLDEVVVPVDDSNDKIEDQVPTLERPHEVVVPVDDSNDKIEDQTFTNEVLDEIVPVHDSSDKIEHRMSTTEVNEHTESDKLEIQMDFEEDLTINEYASVIPEQSLFVPVTDTYIEYKPDDSNKNAVSITDTHIEFKPYDSKNLNLTDEASESSNDFESNKAHLQIDFQDSILNQGFTTVNYHAREMNDVLLTSTVDTTISIEEKPLTLMEEDLLASIEDKPLSEVESLQADKYLEGNDVPFGVDEPYPSVSSVHENTFCHTATDSVPNSKEVIEQSYDLKEKCPHTKPTVIEQVHSVKVQLSLGRGTSEIIKTRPKLFDMKPLMRQDSRDLIDDSKPINPKKRIVRSFEQLNEHKKTNEPENVTIEVSKLKHQLMEKLDGGVNVPPPVNKFRDYCKPKSLRNLILERQREEEDEEDSRISRRNNIDLDLKECPKKILDSPFNEDLEDTSSADSSAMEFLSKDDSQSTNNLNFMEPQVETALNLVMETVNERAKQELSMDLDTEMNMYRVVNDTEPVSQLKHADILDITETLPEPKIDNHFDELVCEHTPNIANTNQETCKTTIESELNNSIEEYVQTCINYSHTEKSEEPEDLSALTTLAAVSELKTNFHDIHTSRHAESSKLLADLQNTETPNLTFVTEDDLADGQVEITSAAQASKLISLSSFSVDFPEVKEPPRPSRVARLRKARRKDEHDSIEKSLGQVFADEANIESDNSISAPHDIEDHIPSVLLCNASGKKRLLSMEKPEYSSSKLLEILTDGKLKPEAVEPAEKLIKTNSKFDPKHTKFIIKSTSVKLPVVDPVKDEVSVQKILLQKNIDFEDIDAFIIQKPGKKSFHKEERKKITSSPMLSSSKKIIQPPLRGKAKILQQTIIKPANDTRLSTAMTTTSQIPITHTSVDDNAMFDINSMPIVLSDQILTSESIEHMPVVISEAVPSSSVIKSVGSTMPTNTTPCKLPKEPYIPKSSPVNPTMLLKTYSQKIKATKNTTPKIVKTQPTLLNRPGPSDKFIIVPSASTSTGHKTPTKRPALLKKPSVIAPTVSTPKLQPTPIPESTGNKIMVVTNSQGQQSRVLLTPSQQRDMGFQTAGNRLVRSAMNRNLLHKTSIIRTAITTTASNSETSSKATIISSAIVSPTGEIVSTVPQMSTSELLITGKVETVKQRKIQINPTKILLQPDPIPGSSKTIVIKNPQGQVVKKIAGSDDALLEQQVQEQVKAIKASGSFAAMKAKQEIPKPKVAQKRSYSRKVTTTETGSQRTQLFHNTLPKIPKTESIPPLTPISPKKGTMAPSQSVLSRVSDLKTALKETPKAEVAKAEAPGPATHSKGVNKVIIRDALGNQTTIAEGQIIALPSGETVDGRPHSYVLVTLDQAGSLMALNSEAILSLDSDLLGGDLRNMVMQFDSNLNQNVTTERTAPSVSVTSLNVQLPRTTATEVTTPQALQTVCNLTGPSSVSNQQFIITGDAVATQKLLESLSEGNHDLASLLAGAEGNILIQTDDQQIFINTENQNQLLPVPQETNAPLFSKRSKSQDILAAALAGTDVFQQEPSMSLLQSKLPQLSPNTTGLYPLSVANVLETTLSLSSPIMTPLEVTSTNTKKIPDEEADMLTTEVAKNVDLPITITDPNIAQTVSQQLLANSLDIPLSISDPGGVPLSSAELNSPSLIYSLPSLGGHGTPPRTYSGPISMPLLNEDSQTDIDKNEASDLSKSTKSLYFDKDSDRSFLGDMDSSNEDLLSNELCSSLSEPPPDMFDLAVLNTDYRGMEIKQGATSHILRPELLKLGSSFNFNRNGHVTSPLCMTNSPPATMDENSCEIPVQPPIVADLSACSYANNEPEDFSKRENNNDENIENDRKRIKFD